MGNQIGVYSIITGGSVTYNLWSGANGTDVSLGIIGLSKVKHLKFDFSGGQQNGGVSYTELAAYGRPTPVVTVSLSAQTLSPGLTNLVLHISGLLSGQK